LFCGHNEAINACFLWQGRLVSDVLFPNSLEDNETVALFVITDGALTLQNFRHVRPFQWHRGTDLLQSMQGGTISKLGIHIKYLPMGEKEK